MLIKQLYHFFHKLKTSLKTKQSSFVVEKFPGIENVLNSLFSLFLIFGYKKVKDSNDIEVFLKYDSIGNPILRDVVWLVKGSVNYVATIEKIKMFKSKYSYSTGFVLTRKGVLDFHECVKQNATGILLVVLK